VPSRVTAHRVLTRNGLVRAHAQQQQAQTPAVATGSAYAPVAAGLVGGVFLADGLECELLTCIDDHPRFADIAKVLSVPSRRAVADALVEAMRTYGVPPEVLTDKGNSSPAGSPSLSGSSTSPWRCGVMAATASTDSGCDGCACAETGFRRHSGDRRWRHSHHQTRHQR
jgi:hypothetical protein